MIPDGWNVCKINELSHYITSGSRGWAQYYSDSGDLFVRITNLTRERLSLDLSDSKYVEIPENSNEGKRTRLMVGDILISITADLGIIGFVENEFDKPAYINQHVALLRIDEKGIDNRFIAYQMASESGHQQFISLNDAGAKSGLNLDSIRRFSILIPPLLEQCRIAEMLGVWDESIDLLERLIGRTRSHKQGLMQQLLTGKKRFKEFEGSEWKRYKQNQVAHFYNGRAYKLSEWEEIGTPVIRLQNLTGTGKNFYYSNLELPEHQYVNSGDLLYMWSATFGPHIWQGERAIYHYHIWKVVCNDNLLSKNFFYFLLDFETQQKMSKSNGMGILHITKSTMESTQVILPSLPEQEKIAAVLSAADEEISTLEKQLAAYKQQKLGLMQQLLTGRIRI